MTIKRSMLLISILVILLSSTSIISLNYSLKKESELKNGQILLAEIDNGILMLRRHEKDFLLRKNLKYVNKFTTSIEKTFNDISQLEQLLKQEGADTASIQKLSSVLQQYQTSFNAMIKSYEKVGLNEKSGLQGKLRVAAHAIEYEVKEANSLALYTNLLMLRRYEKDFLLRLNTKYAERFNQGIIKLQSTLKAANLSSLENHEISSLSSYYQDQFNAMVEGYTQAGLDSNSGQQGEMRKAIHQTNEVLKVTGAQISEVLLGKVTVVQNISNVIIIVIALLMLLITILVTRRIMCAVNTLKQAIHQTDTTNDFSLRSSYDSQDEIGEISLAFNQLISRLQQSIKEANSVMNAVAGGDFTQRITTPLSGDLQKLKQGVNNSAESVECMMSELDKVLQTLNDGNFEFQMNQNITESFRNKVDNTLHNLHSPIGNILQVMSDVKQGNYTTRVTVEAKGDLNQLKIEVNETVEALEKAINDINRVVSAQQSGDLTQQITAEYPGQLASLTHGINSTNLKLMNVIHDVDNTILSVTKASSHVSQGAADLNELIKEQSAAVEETSTTMDKMSANVQNNTESSNSANHAIKQVQSNAENGGLVMQKTIDAMAQIQESSHKIAEIVSLIDGIAFQTNLLALNAAVEAARAGDLGRGFAVVAGEVRNLAGKSAEAAKDIKSLIEESVKRIDQGTQLASESGDVLKEITSSVQEVSEIMEYIANASEDQARGVNQVHSAIAQINLATQKNAGLVQETSESAEDMQQQASDLRESIHFFKIEHNHRLEHTPK